MKAWRTQGQGRFLLRCSVMVKQLEMLPGGINTFAMWLPKLITLCKLKVHLELYTIKK